jgi:[DsrC]-trisulfide reductase subunit J
MRNVILHRIVTGCALALWLGLAASVSSAADANRDHEHASRQAGRVPLPAFSINEQYGDKCVQPEEVMRRNHMQFILHERKETVHEGIRTKRYSLKNCVDCHADPKTGSVLGKDGFCASCHRYAAVSIDCFECHSSQREANVTPTTSAARALNDKAELQKSANDLAKGGRP